ncbi:MAG: AAA family ATPase [Thermoplasmata archaeon]|nr:AAA family ATPase [Thermoplasmata archaeon]
MATAAPRAGDPVPLFGRREVIEELLARLQRARAGQGHLVLLFGEGGVGKTTLLQAAGGMGDEYEFQVVVGRSLPVDLPEPFQLVRDLIKAAQQLDASRDQTAPEPAPSLPMFLAPYEPPTAPGVFRGAGVAGGDEAREANRLLDHLANPLERVDANRSALFARLGEFITQLASERPVLFLLDDLHFADDSSLEFLKEFLPSLAPLRILIIAGVLPATEAPARTREAIEALTAVPAATSLSIPALSEPELGEYARWLLRGRDPGREAVMRWFTQTEGNPLFAEYLVRASAGISRPTTAAAEAGQDFGELIKARIGALTEPEQRLLVYGSVLGKEFSFPTLALAAGQEEERLSESLDHLVHEGLLREKGGEIYEFVSERARADVYAQLTETRRRLLHRKVAAALELHREDRPGDVYELARQLYLGRGDRKAVEYNRRAADMAAHAYAFDTAVVHLERALESLRRLTPRDLTQEMHLLIELGRYLDELGDLRRSEEMLLDAVARARTDPERDTELALALLGLAQTRSDLTQYVSARDLAIEAFGILERKGHQRGLFAAHRVLGTACWRMGDLTQAEQHQTQELAIAEESGTAVEQGHALIDLANTYTLQVPARSTEARGLYERAAALFAESEDQSAHARVLMNLALLLHYEARPVEALAKMQEALAAAERSRSRIWIGYCSLNLAQFYAERRDLGPARVATERAQTMLVPFGDQLAHQQLTMIRGIIAVGAEQYDEAEKLYREATTLAQALDLSAEAAEMEYRFADLEVRRGRCDRAKAHLAVARAAGIERLRADLLPRLAELTAHIEHMPVSPQS